MLQNLSHIESLLFHTVFLWDLDVGLDRAAAWRIHGAVLGGRRTKFSSRSHSIPRRCFNTQKRIGRVRKKGSKLKVLHTFRQ